MSLSVLEEAAVHLSNLVDKKEKTRKTGIRLRQKGLYK